MAKGRPILGSLLDFRDRRLAFVDELRDQYGDVVRVRLAHLTALFLFDPAGAERVFVENAKNYSKKAPGYDVLRLVFGNGLVTSEGEHWLRQRRIAQPAFHREKIAGFAALFAQRAEEQLSEWCAGGDRVVDLAHDLMRLNMRIAGETLFSVDVTHDADRAGAAIEELISQVLVRITGVVPIPLFIPTPLNVRQRRAHRVIVELVDKIIATRHAQGDGGPRDVLALLMAAVDEETGARMDDRQLRDEVITLFSAGLETTSNLLAWTFHLLLDAPDVVERLRAEIVAAAPSGTMSLEAVMGMRLLDATLKESMRLYPPVWSIMRRCEGDDVVSGVRVRAGELVFVPQWSIHRHPRLWREPLRFDPERFLNAEDGAAPRWAYFPFLGGPRKCIGDAFAMLQAKLLLATFLRGARFSRGSTAPVVPEPTITLRMQGGLPVRISPHAAP